MGAYSARVDEPLLTLEEYERLSEDGRYRDELVRGRLVREPQPGAEHGWLGAKVVARLARYLDDRQAGVVLTAVGFIVSPGEPATVRGPDVAYLSEDRIPPEGLPTGFIEGAPDLAVEVVSPSNRAAEMEAKVGEYLDAGARVVWVVYPRRREVAVYRSRDNIRILMEDAVVDGGDVLPGLEIPLTELFTR